MSDKKRTPVGGYPAIPSPRHQTSDDRALEGARARKERESTPVGLGAGAVRAEIPDELTDRFEGEELAKWRAMRDPEERLAILETKSDAFVQGLAGLQGEVRDMREEQGELSAKLGEVSGKLDVVPQLVDVLSKSVQRSAERDHVTFTAKVDVDKAQQLAAVRVNEEEALDTVKARAIRRKTIYKIVGGIAGGGTLIELLHRLGIL